MTTTLSILILAIAALCFWRILRRKRKNVLGVSGAPGSKTFSAEPIHNVEDPTDEEMERWIEENDKIYEQLMAEGRTLRAMFATHDAKTANEANPIVTTSTPQKRRNRTASATEPRKRRKRRIPVATCEPPHQHMPQENPAQKNSAQQSIALSAPQFTTPSRVQSRLPAATWYSRFVAPIQIAASRVYVLARAVVLMPPLVTRSLVTRSLLMQWFTRPKPPANLPQEPAQRRLKNPRGALRASASKNCAFFVHLASCRTRTQEF